MMVDLGDTNINQKGKAYGWIIKALFPVLEMGFCFFDILMKHVLCFDFMIWQKVQARK